MDTINAFFESGAFFILFVIVVVILCMREIRCWYWKINEQIGLLNQQIHLLSFILEHQDEEIELLRYINHNIKYNTQPSADEEVAATQESDS